MGRSNNASFLFPTTHVPLWELLGTLLRQEWSRLLHATCATAEEGAAAEQAVCPVSVGHFTRESDEDPAQCWERVLMAPKLSCVTEEGYSNYHGSKPISERNNLPWEAGTLYLAPAEHLD